MIGLAANHHAVKRGQMPGHLFLRVDAAVDADHQIRKFPLEAVHEFITQRRHLAVFLGGKALEPGIVSMMAPGGSEARRLAADHPQLAHLI